MLRAYGDLWLMFKQWKHGFYFSNHWAFQQHDVHVWQCETFPKKRGKIDILFLTTVTVVCGCYIIGNCLLRADFGSQHYWLWVTPDARVGWAMSCDRMELMSVPWGGCLSFGQGIVSRLTSSKIHQKLSVRQTTCSLKHIRHGGHLLSKMLLNAPAGFCFLGKVIKTQKWYNYSPLFDRSYVNNGAPWNVFL